MDAGVKPEPWMVTAVPDDPAFTEVGETPATFGCGYDNETGDVPLTEGFAWLVATTVAAFSPCGRVAGAV